VSVSKGAGLGRPSIANGEGARPPHGTTYRAWTDWLGATAVGAKPSLRVCDVRIPATVKAKYREKYPPLPVEGV
jgi:hypothetical protein